MRRIALALLILFALPGCSLSVDWYHHYQIESAIERQDFTRALDILQKIIQHEPDGSQALNAARRGSRVAQLDAKNYPLAIEFYRHIVLRSPDSEERRQAQKVIAEIQYENLQDYNQAVVEYEKLLRLQNQPSEAFRYRLLLAKSQLRLNNIDQAVAEIDLLLNQNHARDEIFEAKVLKANTLVAARQLPEAASLWHSILKDFPEKSKRENVALNLVVCYEEMNDFSQAIEVLESMRVDYAHPDFLDLRIQRLKERAKNQPGAQGFHR